MLHQEFNSVSGGHNEISYYIGRGFPVPHIHHSAELILVKTGTVRLQADDFAVVLLAGDVALVLPDQVHSFELDESSACFVQVFSTDCATGFFHALGTHTIKHPVVRPDAHTLEYWRACCISKFDSRKYEAGHSYNITEQLPPLKLRSVLYAILSDFLSCEMCERKGAHEQLFGKVTVYMIEHCTEELTLASVAEHFGYEPHYFSRLLKRVSSFNFRRLINRCRVDIAVELLENSSESIAEIASACGYDSQRTFNRVFKQFEGCTPQEYREQALSTAQTL